MVFLDFGVGLRRGELAGIKWEDIDFGLGQLMPKHSIVRQHIGPTKTEASHKPIPLDEFLISDLQVWRAMTPYAQDSDYVFASPAMHGKQPYWLDSFFRKRIKPVAPAAGITLKGWHTLRHTYSTLLKSKRERPKGGSGIVETRGVRHHDGWLHPGALAGKAQGPSWRHPASGTTAGTTEIGGWR